MELNLKSRDISRDYKDGKYQYFYSHEEGQEETECKLFMTNNGKLGISAGYGYIELQDDPKDIAKIISLLAENKSMGLYVEEPKPKPVVVKPVPQATSNEREEKVEVKHSTPSKTMLDEVEGEPAVKSEAPVEVERIEKKEEKLGPFDVGVED